MSRKILLETCALCEMLKQTSEMVDVRVRDAHGEVAIVRFCRSCAAPRLTYIQSRENHRS
jgi:RNase P subunit RPR2